MRPYIPKQIKPIRERIEVKLDQELIVELEQYCQYLESDRDYIIAQALRVAFRKDKGFAQWQQTHPLRKAGIDGTDGTNPPKTRSPK
jgi:hypothetical protein